MLKSHPRSVSILLVLSAAAFVAAWNFTFLAPVLTDVAEDTDVSVSVAGQLVTASALSAVVCLALFGPLSDRHSRRMMMGIGLGAMAVASFGSALIADYAGLLGLRLLSGVGDAFLLPSTYVAAADYFKDKDREVALNILLVPLGAAVIIGLPVVVVINEVADWHAAFAAFGVINLLILLAVFSALPRVDIPKDTRPLGEHYRRSWGDVLGNRSAQTVLLAAILGAAVWNGMVTYVGAFFEDELGAEGAELAGLFAAVGTSYVIGGAIGVVLARRSRPWPIAVWSGCFAAVLPFAVVTSTAIVPLTVLLAMAFAASRAPGVGALNNMLMDLAPHAQGTAIAAHGVVFMSGAFVGAVGGGLAISLGGYTAMGALFAVFAAGALALLLVPAVSRAPEVLKPEGVPEPSNAG